MTFPKSILLVEDDAMVLDLLSQALRFRYPDLSIWTAADGKAGIEQFAANPASVIITDVALPVIDGVEMARQILSIDPATHVVVISAFGEKAMKEKTAQAGITIPHTLCKPLDYTILFGLLDRLLDH